MLQIGQQVAEPTGVSRLPGGDHLRFGQRRHRGWNVAALGVGAGHVDQEPARRSADNVEASTLLARLKASAAFPSSTSTAT